MGTKIDATGHRYGRLVAIRYVRTDHERVWLFRCDCGNEKELRIGQVRAGISSCGCLQREAAAKLCVKRSTHGKSRTRLHNIWHSMKARCYLKTAINYPAYGGCGISVCDDWLRFEPFQQWALSHGYNDNLTIDRIESKGNYEPSNCRWATMLEQANNRSANKKFTHNGVTRNLKEWALLVGVKSNTIMYRINSGCSFEDAIKKGRKKNVKRKAQ